MKYQHGRLIYKNPQRYTPTTKPPRYIPTTKYVQSGMVAVCTLGCDRKQDSLHSWDALMDLDGNYHLYISFETKNPEHAIQVVSDCDSRCNSQHHPVSLDVWSWQTMWGAQWRTLPKFDQDQARLASIVCARNMSIEFAMQTGASHLLFIDADIIPPKDVIPRLLEVGHPTVAGYVHGRGAHKDAVYVFQEKRRFMMGDPPFEVIEAEHANIGFTMIERKIFHEIRFRYGDSKYPDGSIRMVSDDPAYHLDVFTKFQHWMLIRTDVVGNHVGDLKNDEVSQF